METSTSSQEADSGQVKVVTWKFAPSASHLAVALVDADNYRSQGVRSITSRSRSCHLPIGRGSLVSVIELPE
jgi:hypothetical protein